MVRLALTRTKGTSLTSSLSSGVVLSFHRVHNLVCLEKQASFFFRGEGWGGGGCSDVGFPCSPAPPSTLWDARHGPVRWMPTGSFGDRSRHCGRLVPLLPGLKIYRGRESRRRWCWFIVPCMSFCGPSVPRKHISWCWEVKQTAITKNDVKHYSRCQDYFLIAWHSSNIPANRS